MLRSYSWYPAVSPLSFVHLLVPFKTTRWAGRLTPMAKVEVVHKTYIHCTAVREAVATYPLTMHTTAKPVALMLSVCVVT